MAGYKIVDAKKLDADLTSVANAIRKKAGTTAKMEFPAGFESAVKNIPSGGAELPELGDTAAQPTDMVAGKVLYDDNGNPVTGTLIEADEIDEALFGANDFTFGGTPGGTTFSVKGAYAGNTDGVVVRIGAGLGVLNAPTDFFGDARLEDVAKGRKFTSAAGLLVEGTHECEGGVELPELGDTAAQASDMAVGKVLYDDDGTPVTGTLGVVAEGENFMQSSNVKLSVGQMLVAQVPFNPQSGVEGAILRPGANIALMAPAENLGNATANQVSEKATFTSANGLLVPGELPDGGMLRLTGGTAYGYIGDGTGVLLEASMDEDRIFRAGDNVGVVATYDKFGDATADDVAKGKTFTSAAGFLVEGELECEGGVELPKLGDTAAQPTDMVAGKVLYDDNGNPVTGTLIEADEIDEALFGANDFTFGGTPGGTTFSVKGAYAGNTDGVVVRIGAGLGVLNAPTDFFGDARLEDVAKGRKFTSAAGLLVEGTREEPTAETWVLTLQDGSTVEKVVHIE